MKFLVLGVASLSLVLVLSAPAHAGGVEDGNAGLDALNAGQYDEAIRLFTRALQPGRLKPQDREFAYFNRGKAYAAKGDLAHAAGDLKQAVRLSPDDADAQKSLDEVLARQNGAAIGVGGSDGAGQADGASAQTTDATASWGMLSAMAGRYYWYQVAGEDPHAAYVKLAWATPQEALSVIVASKTDQLRVAEYKMDDRSHKILVAELAMYKPQYGTIEATASRATEYTYVAGAPIRVIDKLQPDGSILETRQTFANAAWRDASTARLVETTIDDLTAQGLIKAKRR